MVASCRATGRWPSQPLQVHVSPPVGCGSGGCGVTTVTGPPQSVLFAFGLRGTPVRLVGGQGTSWRVGDVVLKPRVDRVFQEWLGTEEAAIPPPGLRRP